MRIVYSKKKPPDGGYFGCFGFGIFGGAIFPTAASKRSHASGATSTARASLSFRRFGLDLAPVMATLETFYTQYSRPTDSWCLALGKIAMHWSVVEAALETLIIRLAQAPDSTGLALTNDLSPDNRIKALKLLTYRHRHGFDDMPPEKNPMPEIIGLPKIIAELKTRRNKFVHYVWFRRTDTKMFGVRFYGVPRRDPKARPQLDATVDDAFKLAAEIEALADRMWNLLRLIPETQPHPWPPESP